MEHRIPEGLTEEEERQQRIERNQALIKLIDAWRKEDQANLPTEQDLRDWQEFIRSVDAERPHRPLFKNYYKS